MRDSQEVRELEGQIALDKKRFGEIECLDDELVENVRPRDFSALSKELRLRGEKEALATSIKEGEQMVAGLRNHPDWPHNQGILRRAPNVNPADIAVAAYYRWLNRKRQNRRLQPVADRRVGLGSSR
jgi:hypothetical protein